MGVVISTREATSVAGSCVSISLGQCEVFDVCNGYDRVLVLFLVNDYQHSTDCVQLAKDQLVYGILSNIPLFLKRGSSNKYQRTRDEVIKED